MEYIRFTVPGKPQGKARARTGYNPIAKRVTSCTPETTVLYENLIKTCYMSQTDRSFHNGESLAVNIIAFFEPLKNESKKRRAQMLEGLIFPMKKPDIDNITKAVLDALNGVAYQDDKQVIKLEAFKRYDERARLEIKIKKFG